MTDRAIRRAQERNARKQEQKEARLVANRQNALLSTGPRTEAGKSISSLNAVKTGLTGRTVLLPSDDAAAYQAHIEAYHSEYQPAGLRECELVQSLADTAWRLKRIPGLEMAIYAQGRAQFADAFDDHHHDLRSAMIELRTHLEYEKQLRNLQLQEARLVRRYEKEMAELRGLQSQRKQKEEQAKALECAAPITKTAGQPAIGFEFPDAANASFSRLPDSVTDLHLSPPKI